VANPYYTYGQASGNGIIPGMLGRAEAVAAEFQSVQNGFADLATAGTDSGSVNAYVVATPAGQPSSLSDGQQVSFRAKNTNTGAATIAVNGLTATMILRPNGSAIQPGDITANVWITLTYNTNYSAWCLPSSTSVTTYAGTISGAAPVNPATLVAVAGVATAAMPIDAVIAISTAISPTWIGNHTFTGTSSFSGPITISGTAAISGPLSISGITTHSAGVAFTGPASFSGTATIAGVLAVSGTSSFAGPVSFSGTSSASGPWTFSNNLTVSGTASISGPLNISGTSSASGPWTFSNNLIATGTSSFGGSLKVSAVTTLSGALSVTSTAAFSGPVTASGAFSVSGLATFAGTGGPTVQVNSASGQYGVQVNGASFAGLSLIAVGGTFGTSDFFQFQNSGSLDGYVGLRGSNQLHFQTNSLDRLVIGTAGAVTINGPASGIALTVNGASGTHSTQIEDSAGNAFNAGYLEVPQRNSGTSYTCVLSDSGKRMYASAGGITFTIPSNASVPYPVGAVIGFMNMNASSITIAINSDTLYWLGSGSTGSRTLAQYGEAYAEKITTTAWAIKGVNIT